jgi:hypothetical protein
MSMRALALTAADAVGTRVALLLWIMNVGGHHVFAERGLGFHAALNLGLCVGFLADAHFHFVDGRIVAGKLVGGRGIGLAAGPIFAGLLMRVWAIRRRGGCAIEIAHPRFCSRVGPFVRMMRVRQIRSFSFRHGGSSCFVTTNYALACDEKGSGKARIVAWVRVVARVSNPFFMQKNGLETHATVG